MQAATNSSRLLLQITPQTIGSLYTFQGLKNYIQKISPIIIVDQMGDDLRIRPRYKLNSLSLELILDLHVVFDDPDMDNSDISRHIGMGMGVHIGRLPMGSPPGMPNAHGAG